MSHTDTLGDLLKAQEQAEAGRKTVFQNELIRADRHFKSPTQPDSRKPLIR